MIFYSILARICRKSKKKPQKKGGFWVFYDPEAFVVRFFSSRNGFAKRAFRRSEICNFYEMRVNYPECPGAAEGSAPEKKHPT